MGAHADAAKAEDEEKSGGERKPLFWGLAIGVVVLSLAVAYKIVKSDGQVDFQGGLDGIQVKVSQAQKTIEAAQVELTDTQKQLDERAAALKAQEQALAEREAKVQELLASVDKTAAAPPTLTPQQAQVELKKLRAAPPVALTAPEPVAVKARLERLNALRDNLNKTNTELKAASAATAAKQ